VGLVSSAVGFQLPEFTDARGPMGQPEFTRLVRLALDMGITMIDAIGCSAASKLERFLGVALAGRRERAVIATAAEVRTGPNGRTDLAHLSQAGDESLRRLKTDYIDLCYLPATSPDLPVEEGIGRLAELVTAGKIRYLGLSGASGEQLRRAHAVHPISAVCVEYSLRHRDAETGPLAVAAELGIGVVAARPLAGGLLTGRIGSGTSTPEQISLRAIEGEAAELDLGVARLSLAWLLTWRDDVVPIPRSRNPAHLEMNASAPEIRLAPAVRTRLAQLFPPS
jgi:aryl-alcohol dehydrogenase-like predicted oxidoreductase